MILRIFLRHQHKRKRFYHSQLKKRRWRRKPPWIIMSFLNDAFKSYELHDSLDRISTDDGKAVEDYTMQQVLSEAYYVLSCFYEDGHVNNDLLNSDIKDERQQALKEIKVLKSFIKKYQGNLTLNKLGA